MSTKQEIVSDAAFKASPFSSDFNFACKDGQVTATRCKYYCPLVANLTITNAKSSILNVAEFLDPSLKTFPCTKTSPARVKTSLFSYYFEMWLPLSKVIVFFCYFLQYNETVFDQPVRRLLPLPCFYGSSQWLLKVKITCKRVNFVKK